MRLSTTPDTELAALLERVGQRDAAALQQLYERTSPRLFGLALRIVRRHDVAEDVLQEVFLTIWRSAPDYRASLSPPLAWMGLIVRSRALDQLRRQTADRAGVTQEFDDAMAEALPADAAGPMDLADAGEQAFALHQCLQQLEGRQREVLSLAYLSELSHAELSERLTLPLGTVKTWIRRGLDKLRVCMERIA